ncbi:MAG: ABC transporter ATP-binding protein [Erysipelotrichaceae bacterium]
MEHIISIKKLTRDYGHNKGIFDVDLTVNKGEVYGFLGPNGAGKTTTIRHLMGFMQAKKGEAQIFDLDCFLEAEKIQKRVGYLAGELATFDDLSGQGFLDFVAAYQGLHDTTKMKQLIALFELDTRGKVSKMSKGMKQKLGIVAAFMGDAEVLILDEPTSGLDPLMQNRFVELILEEKSRGKTILMSSHIFEEVEKTCDRTAIIKDGRIVAIEDMQTLQRNKAKTVFVSAQIDVLERLQKQIVQSAMEHGKLKITMTPDSINEVLAILASETIDDLDIKTASLEEIFLHFYGKEVD